MMENKAPKNKNGQALIVVVVLFLFLLAGLEAAVLLYMHNRHRLRIKEITLTDSFYYVHGGIERAMWKIKADPNYKGEVYSIPGTSVPIVISVETLQSPPNPPGYYNVISYVLQLKAGSDLSLIRRVSAIVQRVEETVNEKTTSRVTLIQWKEIPPQLN